MNRLLHPFRARRNRWNLALATVIASEIRRQMGEIGITIKPDEAAAQLLAFYKAAKYR